MHNKTKTTTIRKRVEYLDTIAGILIIFMLGCHLDIINFSPTSWMNLFSLYMAWFFFKSGMFHKEQGDFKQYTNKLVKKLIVPFAIFTIFGFIMEATYKPITVYSLRGLIAQVATMGFAWCNAPLWFIFALFLTRLITSKFNGRYWILWIAIFIGIAAIHNQLFTERFQYIGNVSLSIVYYILGYKMKSWHENKYVVIACFLIYTVTFYFMPTFLDIRSNSTSYGLYMVAIAVVVPGIVALNGSMSHIKIPIIGKFLTWIGENAIGYVLFHWPIMLTFKQLPPPIAVSDVIILSPTEYKWIVATITLLISTAFVVIVNHFPKLHWVIGK